MSTFNIALVADTPLAAVDQPTRFGAGTRAAAAIDISPEIVAVDAIPSSPPAEVLQAMGAAAHAYHRLNASGRELRFEAEDQTRRVSVSVHDLLGSVLATISPSKALDIAATGKID